MNVSKGISTYVGYIAGGGLLLILPMVSALADALAPFGVPVQTWVFVGAALTAVTILGRMWQAASMTRDQYAYVGHSATSPTDDVPTGD